MMERSWGRIVNVTSIAGIYGMKYLAHYSAAKAGLIALTKTLAAESYQYNVTVNAVAAGLTKTDMGMSIFQLAKDFLGYKEDPEKLADKWAKRHTLLGRLIEPWEVARVVLFLADPDSTAITGQVIVIDGGQYLVETARYDEI
jgi:3-oxoacyl-[acyl-carrier protein] reductase